MAPLELDLGPIQADTLLTGTSSTKCMVCGKKLDHLNEVRRSLHINSCLDEQESKEKHEKEQKKWESTYDCPMCKEPLGPGPVCYFGIYANFMDF